MKKLFIIPVTLILASGIAIAAGVSGEAEPGPAAPGLETPTPALPSFNEVDLNQDGCIDSEEAAMVPELEFDAADADGDGCITEEEYTEYKETVEGEPAMEEEEPIMPE